MLIFKYLPDVKIGWRDVWLGALVTAVLFKLGQYGLALYFKFGSTTSAYGAAGSLVAVLLWAYYSACILFFGAEFTQAYARQMGGYIEPDEDAVPVTDEERAQHGMPRKRDVEESYAAVQLNAGHRGGMPRLEPVPQRRVVTITRPAPGTARSAGIAAAGLAAGFVVAAIGLLKGRKYERQGLEQIRLKKRLERVEDRVRQVALHEARMARTQSNGNKPQWKDQFASIKTRVREALHV
jgi:membrane protein